MEKEIYCCVFFFFFCFFLGTHFLNVLINKYYIVNCRSGRMAKKSFAPPVTNFSISCDPSMVTWLNDYAHTNKTSRSKIVRKALIDFRAEHKAADTDANGAKIDPEERCINCGAAVIRNFGVVICMGEAPRCRIEADPAGGNRMRPLLED